MNGEKLKKTITAFAFFVAMTVVAFLVVWYARGPTLTQHYGMYEVITVSEESNLVIKKPDGERRVHLIGVSAEECSKKERKAATKYVKKLTLGKEVSIEYDRRKTSNGIIDFVYMYLADGRMINALLLSEGYADYGNVYGNTRYEKQLKALRNEAKSEKKGIWKGEEE